MQPKVLILLAVLFDVATAGLVRHNGRLVRYGRSSNASSVSVAPLQPHASTSSSQSQNTTLPVKAVSTSASSFEVVSKQVGSVPAFGDGPGAATVDSGTLSTQTRQSLSAISSSFTSTSAVVPLPSSKPSLPSTPQNNSASIATSKQVGSAPAFGDGPGAATIGFSPTTSTTKGPLSTSIASHSTTSPLTAASSGTGAIRASKEADSSTLSTRVSFSRSFTLGTGIGSQNPSTSQAPIPSSATTFQPTTAQSLPSSTPSTGATTSPKAVSSQSTSEVSTQTSPPSVSSASVSVISTVQSSTSKPASTNPSTTSGQTAPPALTNIPNAQNGNIAMALGFNAIFETMVPESSCDASNSNQASACINGQPAQCGPNGKYVTTACPQGQRCFALPLPAGNTGITVQCATPGDANAKLGLGAPSGSVFITNSQAPTSIGAQGPSSASAATQSSQGVPNGSAQGPSKSPSESTLTSSASSPTSAAAPPRSTESANAPTAQVPPTTSTDSPVVISFPSDTSSPSSGNPTPLPRITASSTSSAVSTAPAAAVPKPAATSAPTTSGSSITSAPLAGNGPVTITETVTVTTTAR